MEVPLQDTNVIGAFGDEQAARLSGLTIGQLKAWDRSGFLKPSLASENRHLPYSRVYSFRDIVALRVLGQLRNQYKIPLQHLRKVSEKLSHLGEEKWISTTLFVLGKRVVWDDPNHNQKSEIVSGQGVFNIPLRVVISNTRTAIAEMNRRAGPEVGNIVKAKFINESEPVFAGSRISVSAVVHYLDAGFSPEMIISEFPGLTLADVEAASNFRNGKSAA